MIKRITFFITFIYMIFITSCFNSNYKKPSKLEYLRNKIQTLKSQNKHDSLIILTDSLLKINKTNNLILIQAKAALDIDSIDLFKKMIKDISLIERSANAHFLLGIYNLKIKKYNYALIEFEKALRLSPLNEEIKQKLIKTLRINGEYEKAVELLKNSNDSLSFIPSFKTAMLYKQIGEVDSIIKYSKITLSKNPYNRYALKELISSLINKHSYKQVFNIIKMATKYYPNDPCFKFYKGKALIENGSFKKGTYIIEDICSFFPDTMNACIYLTQAYLNNNMWNSAFRIYNKLSKKNKKQLKKKMEDAETKIYKAGIKRFILNNKLNKLLVNKNKKDLLDIATIYQILNKKDSAFIFYKKCLTDSLNKLIYKNINHYFADTLSPAANNSKILAFNKNNNLLFFGSIYKDINQNNRLDIFDGIYVNSINIKSKKMFKGKEKFLSLLAFNDNYNTEYFYGYKLPSVKISLNFLRALYKIQKGGSYKKCFDIDQWTNGITNSDKNIFYGKIETDNNNNGFIDYFDSYRIFQTNLNVSSLISEKYFESVLKGCWQLSNNEYIITSFNIKEGKNVEWIDEVVNLYYYKKGIKEKLIKKEIKNFQEPMIFDSNYFAFNSDKKIYIANKNKIFKSYDLKLYSCIKTNDNTFYLSDINNEIYRLTKNDLKKINSPNKLIDLELMTADKNDNIYFCAIKKDTNIDGNIDNLDKKALFKLSKTSDNNYSLEQLTFYIFDKKPVLSKNCRYVIYEHEKINGNKLILKIDTKLPSNLLNKL